MQTKSNNSEAEVLINKRIDQIAEGLNRIIGFELN